LNGQDDKNISTVHESGVALAAIRGFNQNLETKGQKLEAANAELKARPEKPEQIIFKTNKRT
jgi:hypothetical protein